MSTDPEIDAIVAAALKDAPPGADPKTYRDIAIKSRTEFVQIRSQLEQKIMAEAVASAQSGSLPLYLPRPYLLDYWDDSGHAGGNALVPARTKYVRAAHRLGAR